MTKQIMGKDTYTGDHTDVAKLWGEDHVDYRKHEHGAYCGGYYIHAHKGGNEPHEHDHERCDWCR